MPVYRVVVRRRVVQEVQLLVRAANPEVVLDDDRVLERAYEEEDWEEFREDSTDVQSVDEIEVVGEQPVDVDLC
jgi:hypothetical protein